MSRIVRVEMARYDYSVVGDFKFLKPGPDGKVRRPSIIVRLTDEDGRHGYGQAVPIPSWSYETPETVETTLRRYLAPVLVGADPSDISGIHDRMNCVIRPGFSTGQPKCKAGVDLACYDLLGKQQEQPVYDLLGGAKQRALTLSWTVNARDMAAAEAQLAEGWNRGYRNFNIKVGPPQTPDFDIALAKKVRAFAPDGFLWADANAGYSVHEALSIAPQLADAGVDVLESPLPPVHIQGYQALKRQGALPIIMDEGIMSPVELAAFCNLGMLDGVALKPARNAGLWPSKQIVDLLRRRGLMVLGSGLTDPDLALAAAVHLYAATGISQPCALNGPQFLGETLVVGDSSLTPVGDQLYVPRGPGLGAELDLGVLDFEVLATV